MDIVQWRELTLFVYTAFLGLPPIDGPCMARDGALFSRRLELQLAARFVAAASLSSPQLPTSAFASVAIEELIPCECRVLVPEYLPLRVIATTPKARSHSQPPQFKHHETQYLTLSTLVEITSIYGQLRNIVFSLRSRKNCPSCQTNRHTGMAANMAMGNSGLPHTLPCCL